MRIARPLDHGRKNTLPAVAIAAFFAIVLYTTDGCGGSSPTSPPNTALLSGTVMNAVTGAAIANAKITAVQRGNTFVNVSGSDGRYGFGSLVEGDLRIDADATGYAHFSNAAHVNAGNNTLDIRMQPSP